MSGKGKRTKYQRSFVKGFTGKSIGLKTKAEIEKERKAKEDEYLKSLKG